MRRVAVVAALAALTLAGCAHTTPPPATASSSSSADQLGSLEASVDAIAGQVDSDSSG